MKPGFNNTEKQNEAIKVMGSNITTLLKGGSRSGKTAIAVKMMDIRASRFENTKHLICRYRFNAAKLALWHDTIPKVADLLGIKKHLYFNSTDHYVQFPNGAQLWVGGLDDKERVEKILGQEYATIFANEASQISYDAYEILRTRLNPPKGVPPKFFIDYNPPSKQHWGYKIFHERVFPDGRPVPDNDYGIVTMNPMDNIDNISENYLQILEGLSATKKKRFLLGEYGDLEGALWRMAWMKYKDVNIDQCRRIVIGVDPSGSEGGDEIGIIVAAYDGKDYYILDDLSLHGTPKEWGDEVIFAYEKYSADCIVAEKNFGGDMVESTITDMGRRNVKVKLVNASRGKAVRAEPISAMYERGEVYHVKEFTALEDEYITWKPLEAEDSPNHLDAAVWGLTELSCGRPSIFDVA